jgi:hypothetical protein
MNDGRTRWARKRNTRARSGKCFFREVNKSTIDGANLTLRTALLISWGLICLDRRLVLGATPRGSWAGSEQTECYGSEQCPLRATRWQVDADARDVLDHARDNLDRALSNRRELRAGEAGSSEGSQRARGAPARTQQYGERAAPDWRSRCGTTFDPTAILAWPPPPRPVFASSFVPPGPGPDRHAELKARDAARHEESLRVIAHYKERDREREERENAKARAANDREIQRRRQAGWPI